MAAPLRKTFGLGMLSMFGGEGTQIVAGCTGIVVVAAVVTKTWYSMSACRPPNPQSSSPLCAPTHQLRAPQHSARRGQTAHVLSAALRLRPRAPAPAACAVSDKLPKTHSPQWQAATAKYRQAQKQDPISGH